MSKYIPTDNKPKGQVKPKLKVKVAFNEEERILNEYDAFQMLSDLNNRQIQSEKLIQEIGQAVNAIMDGMKAGIGEEQSSTSTVQMATGPMSTEQYHATGSPYTTEAPVIPSIELPNLKKIIDSSVKLQD